MRGHLLGHFAERSGRAGAAHACLVRVTGHSPIRHWLYARMGRHATLRSLDSLLRSTWLDCCGHLSSFSAGGISYESSDVDMDYYDRDTAMMDVNAIKVLAEHGSLRYEYDYGTTTELFVQMAAMCPGAGIRPRGAELVAMNVDIPYDCTECGGRGAAECVCINCQWSDRETLLCAGCAREHRHDDDSGPEVHLLSAVNSPRMGMCAYREYYL